MRLRFTRRHMDLAEGFAFFGVLACLAAAVYIAVGMI